MKAVPLIIVDGATLGPDGKPLDRFASFVQRMRSFEPMPDNIADLMHLDGADVEVLGDGRLADGSDGA